MGEYRSMPEVTSPQSSTDIIRSVLARALTLTWHDIAVQRDTADPASKAWAVCVRDSWIRSLREAFAAHYADGVQNGSTAVFGGKPRSSEPRKGGCPTGIKGWRRWEYLYDIAVVGVAKIPAPYALGSASPTPLDVSYVTGAIWLVESEVALNGREIAIDASKLRLARSENLLLVAARTTQEDEAAWLKYLGLSLAGCEGEVFLAMLPSYASRKAGRIHWWEMTASIVLYSCSGDGALPVWVGEISASS